MTTVSCPKCGDEVALPAGASPKATVRCPLCQDEFLLSEVLDAMPPLLIVVDDPEAAQSRIAGVPAFGLATEGVDDEELRLAGAEPVSVRPSFGIESSVAPSTAAGPSTRKRRAAPRPKKKRSPVMEIVKVVLGGIAGLTIAQLILWWGFKKDPLTLAPKLGGVAPWILPEKFRGEGNQEGEGFKMPDGLVPAKPGATPGKQGGLPTRGAFLDPNSGGPAGGFNQTKKPGNKPKTPPSGGRDAVADAGTSSDISKAIPTLLPDDPLDLPDVDPKPTDLGGDLVGDLSIDLDPLKMLDPVASPEPKDSSTELTEPARFVNAPVVTADESKEALEDAQAISNAWNLADDADSIELLRQTYRTLAGLGEAITFAAPDIQPDETAVASLLKSLADDEKKLANLGKAGEMWLRATRDSTGVMLRGVVKSIERKGDLYETQLALPSGGDPISLYSDADPAGVYRVDSDVLVLGAFIEDPAANLTGYEGDLESIVWSRLSVVIP